MTPHTYKGSGTREPFFTPVAFRQQRDRIASQHHKGARGSTTCLRLTALTDTILQEAFARHVPGSSLVVVALGGYGRQELCFGSDVDTMVLTRDGADTAVMSDYYHTLLDTGLDVGHSYRTIDDCTALRGTDLDAWISLLDARYVCGDKNLFRELIARMRSDLTKDGLEEILGRIHDLSERRHEKYGRSTKLLEPNIKNSSGGFRDAQTALWLLRITRKIPLGQKSTHTALRSMLDTAAARSIFPERFLSHVGTSLDTLFRIRHQMHLRAGGIHDILEFASQEPIAKALRYRGAGSVSPVERFMREYYEAANTVAELHVRVTDWTRDTWFRPRDHQPTRSLGDGLQVRGNRLLLSRGTPMSTEVLLHAYHRRLGDALEFSYELEDTIHRRADSLTAIRSKSHARQFCALFAQSAGVSSVLRHMNRFGLLARWLPEWRPLVRFFQHNQYHFYTADEHTLTVVDKAERLQHDPSSFGEVYRMLERKDILLLACLFHDITKPQRLDDHEITGAELARSVLVRFGMEEIAEDVSFLVRHHLVMEQVAFRRNLADPITVRDFARTFPRPDLLRYLYVLTFADLSAVNTNVLTAWKKTLLTELYLKTISLLEQKGQAALHKAELDADELIRSLPQEDADRHVSLLRDDAYRRTFSRQEIADHITALRELDAVACIFHQWSDVTDLTLLTQDAPYVLARVCGALYANDISIIDARIFTREDGIVIDAFRIVDNMSHRPVTEDRCRTVEQEIRDVLTGACTIGDLLDRHRRRWKRRHGHVNPNVRIDVVFEEHPHFTIIDVYGADTAGFLYEVSDTISGMGCTIHFAKIATRGDGIVDTFYVRDADGSPIRAAARRTEIRESLLRRIHAMYENIHPAHGSER